MNSKRTNEQRLNQERKTQKRKQVVTRIKTRWLQNLAAKKQRHNSLMRKIMRRLGITKKQVKR